MKKSLRIVAALLVALTLCLCLASCGNTLKGTYTADFAGTGTKLVFDGKDVTISYIVAGKELASIDATYEIKDDEITFKFVEADGEEKSMLEELAEELEKPVSFEKGDDYIKIADVKYEKED